MTDDEPRDVFRFTLNLPPDAGDEGDFLTELLVRAADRWPDFDVDADGVLAWRDGRDPSWPSAVAAAVEARDKDWHDTIAHVRGQGVPGGDPPAGEDRAFYGALDEVLRLMEGK